MTLDWDNVVGGHDKPTSINFYGKQLVVLDAEDREQVERLVDLFMQGDRGGYIGNVDDMQAALRSLLAPPKPPEPQRLAACVEDASGDKWVWMANGAGGPHWTRVGRGIARAYYADITAVRVLSEGVTP